MFHKLNQSYSLFCIMNKLFMHCHVSTRCSLSEAKHIIWRILESKQTAHAERTPTPLREHTHLITHHSTQRTRTHTSSHTISGVNPGSAGRRNRSHPKTHLRRQTYYSSLAHTLSLSFSLSLHRQHTRTLQHPQGTVEQKHLRTHGDGARYGDEGESSAGCL